MQKTSNWGVVISYLVALGVPMTPLQGTIFGYGLLAVAAGLSLWRGFVWVRALHITHKGYGTIEPLWGKIMFLAPTFLLFLIAGFWSYFGGLPVVWNSQAPITASTPKSNLSDESKFETIQGRTFRSEVVPLDWKRYIDCKFYGVSFELKGQGPYQITHSTITGPTLLKTDNIQFYGLLYLLKKMEWLKDGIPLLLEEHDAAGNAMPEKTVH